MNDAIGREPLFPLLLHLRISLAYSHHSSEYTRWLFYVYDSRLYARPDYRLVRWRSLV